MPKGLDSNGLEVQLRRALDDRAKEREVWLTIILTLCLSNANNPILIFGWLLIVTFTNPSHLIWPFQLSSKTVLKLVANVLQYVDNVLQGNHNTMLDKVINPSTT